LFSKVFISMFEGGKRGGFEVKLEKRPTMKSCDQRLII